MFCVLQEFAQLFPKKIVAPGDFVACVNKSSMLKFGLTEDCVVSGGVTDSIAAFVAAGVTEEGEAVTSLGSTLAIKMLSSKRVDAVEYGIYSHRLGEWFAIHRLKTLTSVGVSWMTPWSQLPPKDEAYMNSALLCLLCYRRHVAGGWSFK